MIRKKPFAMTERDVGCYQMDFPGSAPVTDIPIYYSGLSPTAVQVIMSPFTNRPELGVN